MEADRQTDRQTDTHTDRLRQLGESPEPVMIHVSVKLETLQKPKSGKQLINSLFTNTSYHDAPWFYWWPK